MDYFNENLQVVQSCEKFARENDLIFVQARNHKYLIKEFRLDNSVCSTYTSTQPIKRCIKIDNNHYNYYFQTLVFPGAGYEGLYEQFKNIIYATNKEEIEILYDYLQEKYKPVKCDMYTWDIRCECYQNSHYQVPFVNKEDLVGLDDFFNSIRNEIEAVSSKIELLKKLGGDSGTNYFIYGPPGTGKTSSCKAVAHEMNIPVYSVNLSLIKKEHFKTALSPKSDRKIKMVIIEDFDRYIMREEESISELLNSLDGVHSSYGVIRIFSANMPELTLKDKALKTRFTRFIKFSLPTPEMIEKHLVNLFPTLEQGDSMPGADTNQKLITQFVDLVEYMHLSYREINSYLKRFITEENILEAAINYFPEWIRERDEIESLGS